MEFNKNEQEILVSIVCNHNGPRNLRDLWERDLLIKTIRTGRVENETLEILKKLFMEAENLSTDPLIMPHILNLSIKMGVVQINSPEKKEDSKVTDLKTFEASSPFDE